MKTDDIYKNIAEDVETRFDTSNYELDRPLPKGKNKKVIGLMKDELGGKIMPKFVGLKAKTYSYLIDGGSKDEKEKDTKKCVIKRKHKFENYKNSLDAIQLENKINYLEKIKLTQINHKKNHNQFKRSNKSILKTQQRFKSERYIASTVKLLQIMIKECNQLIRYKHMHMEQAKI